MTEWKCHKISDLIGDGLLYIGDGYRAKNDELGTTGLPFARSGTINDGFKFEDVDRFPVENLYRVGVKVSQPSDVVFTSKGTVGRFGFVKADTEKFIYSPQLSFWRSLNQEVILSRFLYYWMYGREFYLQYSGVKGQTDMADYVSLQDQRKMQITLPPLEEQEAIAEILGSIDDKIELNRQMNTTLEATARAIFKSWFVDFDPVHAKANGEHPAGMDAETAALFPDSFGESELGMIPKGWENTSLAELFPNDKNCVLTGPFGSHLHAHDYRDEGTPLILVKHVNNGKILENDLPLVGDHKISELRRYQLKTGDIIFTRVGAVGRSAYVHPRFEGWLISGQTLRVRINGSEQLNPRYLAQVYLEPAFKQMVENYALGTTRPSLNTQLLQNFRFMKPTIEIQNVYGRLVTSFDEKIQSNEMEAQTLVELRDSLLPKLISGQIRVVDIEI